MLLLMLALNAAFNVGIDVSMFTKVSITTMKASCVI